MKYEILLIEKRCYKLKDYIAHETTLLKGWFTTMEIYYIYILMRCMSDGDNGMVEMHDNNGSGGSGVG